MRKGAPSLTHILHPRVVRAGRSLHLRGHAIVYALGRLVGLPVSDQQLKGFLRRVLKGLSARNYRVTPRLWQPDFSWDHASVPLAFSMALTTYSGLFDGIAVKSWDALAGAFLG
jgi:hypothetical protein